MNTITHKTNYISKKNLSSNNRNIILIFLWERDRGSKSNFLCASQHMKQSPMSSIFLHKIEFKTYCTSTPHLKFSYTQKTWLKLELDDCPNSITTYQTLFPVESIFVLSLNLKVNKAILKFKHRSCKWIKVSFQTSTKLNPITLKTETASNVNMKTKT